jgi:uncharacterized protein YecT (DUF1311 family)
VKEDTDSADDLSQQALNLRSDVEVQKLKARLESANVELSSLLDPAGKQLLQESRQAWENYCLKQSDLSRHGFEEGSMSPLIYLSSLEELIADRLVVLETEIQKRRIP